MIRPFIAVAALLSLMGSSSASLGHHLSRSGRISATLRLSIRAPPVCT